MNLEGWLTRRLWLRPERVAAGARVPQEYLSRPPCPRTRARGEHFQAHAKRSGGFEDRVQVPFEELPVRPVATPLGHGYELTSMGVELFPVAKLRAQSRADQ